MNRKKEFEIFGSEKPRYWNPQAVIRNILGLCMIFMIFRETQAYWLSILAFLLLVHTEVQGLINKLLDYRLKNIIRMNEDQTKRILNDLEQTTKALKNIKGQ